MVMRMKWILTTVAVGAVFIAAPWALVPTDNDAVAEIGAARAADAPVVVELFTSQSCFSCPPAEAFLGELVEDNADILALEWHVDYWDDLVYGAAGRWKDVFSDPAYTARQTLYNHAIRGRGAVYTPQMIIGGVDQAVGSRRNEVNAAIATARQTGLAVDVVVESNGDGLRIVVDGQGTDPAAVWLVNYDIAHTTEVLRGENKGKTLTNHHVVRAMQQVGAWSGDAVTIEVADQRAENQGCAVLVQTETLGPLLGAGVCPAQVNS